MRNVTNFKIGLIAGSIRYYLQDKLAGYTTPGRCFRKDYKKSVRSPPPPLRAPDGLIGPVAYCTLKEE